MRPTTTETKTEKRASIMPIVAVIIIMTGLVMIAADHVYDHLMATEAFQTLRTIHGGPGGSSLSSYGPLLWLGVILALIGGAGVTHYLVER